jgi:hypothetical protein
VVLLGHGDVAGEHFHLGSRDFGAHRDHAVGCSIGALSALAPVTAEAVARTAAAAVAVLRAFRRALLVEVRVRLQHRRSGLLLAFRRLGHGADRAGGSGQCHGFEVAVRRSGFARAALVALATVTALATLAAAAAGATLAALTAFTTRLALGHLLGRCCAVGRGLLRRRHDALRGAATGVLQVACGPLGFAALARLETLAALTRLAAVVPRFA